MNLFAVSCGSSPCFLRIWGGRGAENTAQWLEWGERTLLHAEREDFHLVFGSDRGFSRRSVGYLGASDGWQDLHKGNFQMDWQYRQAGPGSLVLTGEVDIAGTEWTFFWPTANRWEGGENFRAEVV